MKQLTFQNYIHPHTISHPHHTSSLMLIYLPMCTLGLLVLTDISHKALYVALQNSPNSSPVFLPVSLLLQRISTFKAANSLSTKPQMMINCHC